MKIIDLLVKIANGEDVPNKINYCGYIFEYYKNHSRYENYHDEQIWLLEDFVDFSENLNDEIEIIEDTPKEDEKIEKLKIYDDMINWCCNGKAINDIEKDIIDKINEIIDKINGDNNE